ncbi:DUF1203 domain-containing protein [Kiloniella sp. b19]|uniref:DUF1203 domain-containing protein n=1 Tax=Kiloniella sp. GXU_MW_B19 TaxID=3141326 RepID=UPI0031DEAFD3
MQIRFTALPTHDVLKVQQGGSDAYGQQPDRFTSNGNGVPCRHCMKMVAEGEDYLALAWRPFTQLQPYAETGPIFLHAESCERAAETELLPEIIDSPNYILRGYSADERIIYGTGKVTPREEIHDYARELFSNDAVAFIHIRSASNNCFHCRIDRA